MGEIIALRPSQPCRLQASTNGSAEILFFTGVRYYRMSDEEFAKASAPKSRSPKAKRSGVARRLKRHG